MDEIEWREGLYRQLARQPGLPAGLRPELIKRAESCTPRSEQYRSAFFTARGGVEGCKGAIGR